MERFVIDHPNNEASALIGILNPTFLQRRKWELGFWIVSDELDVREAIAALGRLASGQWEVVRLRTSRSDISTSKECTDAETMARAGSFLYVFGSQFGSKKGPLQPRRHFVARFNEALIEFDSRDRPSVAIDVVRQPFVLHRLINDALGDVLKPDDGVREKYIGATIARGEGKSWADRIRKDDVPVNVEGATFLEGGRLLLGLRYPCTSEGHPIVVEIEGIDRLFEKDAAAPNVVALHVLANVGDLRRPAGIRELDSRSGWIHVITGSLDTAVMRSASRTPLEHWAFRRPVEDGSGPVKATRVRRFRRKARVEGIALHGDQAWYAHDAEKIELDRAELEFT